MYLYDVRRDRLKRSIVGIQTNLFIDVAMIISGHPKPWNERNRPGDGKSVCRRISIARVPASCKHSGYHVVEISVNEAVGLTVKLDFILPLVVVQHL